MADDSPFRHDKADDSPGFLLWKLTLLWQGRLGNILRNYGITQTQYAILASLRWFEHVDEAATQTQLARHAKIDKMTLSKAIRRMEGAGLIARAGSSTDNRAKNIYFTPSGRDLIQQAVVDIEAADESFFSCLSTDLRDAYQALALQLIAGNDTKTPH